MKEPYITLIQKNTELRKNDTSNRVSLSNFLKAKKT